MDPFLIWLFVIVPAGLYALYRFAKVWRSSMDEVRKENPDLF